MMVRERSGEMLRGAEPRVQTPEEMPSISRASRRLTWVADLSTIADAGPKWA